ncbi:MAG: hypothetical protein ACRCWW_01070 [Scandinavium sp.]|uniref:hypothetical protein n=1 Tax=Scandinavium sp. TaxID=2830653 RepID=UPI003F3184A8
MRLALIAVCLLTASCTNPYPTATPDFPLVKGLARIDKNSENSGNIEIDNAAGISEYERLTAEVKLVDLKIKEKVVKLSNQKYALSDIGFLGGLTSVIAAASGALTTALYSGGVAIGGSTLSQRYNYDVQMLNYNVTRAKLNCIYKAMTELTGKEQLLIVSDSDNVIAGTLRPYIGGVLNDLEFELEKQQTTVSVVAPDLGAVSQFLTQKNAANKLLASKPPASGGNQNFRSYIRMPDNTERLAVVNKISADVGLCKISPSNKNVQISEEQ